MNKTIYETLMRDGQMREAATLSVEGWNLAVGVSADARIFTLKITPPEEVAREPLYIQMDDCEGYGLYDGESRFGGLALAATIEEETAKCATDK